jgi:hypothetical protein
VLIARAAFVNVVIHDVREERVVASWMERTRFAEASGMVAAALNKLTALSRVAKVHGTFVAC